MVSAPQHATHDQTARIKPPRSPNARTLKLLECAVRIPQYMAAESNLVIWIDAMVAARCHSAGEGWSFTTGRAVWIRLRYEDATE